MLPSTLLDFYKSINNMFAFFTKSSMLEQMLLPNYMTSAIFSNLVT